MIFIGKISKGHNSVKNVYGIRVLFFVLFLFFFLFGIRVLVFCTSSDDIDGVKVLFPCTSSDGGLHLYKVS